MVEHNEKLPSLAELLFDEAYRFEFFQAVRLLERIYPDLKPVGEDNEPKREIVKFRTQISLQFPPSQIYQLTKDDNGDDQARAQMVVAFMGLTGPLGILPYHYTELLMQRRHARDHTLWEFLDIFNHRLLSLFYRAWEKHHFPVAYERNGDDVFTQYLFNTVGFGTSGLQRRLSLADENLVFYGGLIAQKPHSCVAITAILADYFGVGVNIEQFKGQWLKLDEENLWYLGKANNNVGVNTIAGKRVWDNQSKFRIRLGPLSLKEFTNLLPVSSVFKSITEFTRLLVGMEFDFDLQLILKAEEVPGCILSSHAKHRPMLGWTTWLKTRPFTQDDSQVVLNVKI